MDEYDPDSEPETDEWLMMDEQERMSLVEDYHRRARVELPSETGHAVVHTIVENQLAQRIPEVQSAMERLRRQGLDRHEAIHAIGATVAGLMHEMMKAGRSEGDPNENYFAPLRVLTSKSWRASAGE